MTQQIIISLPQQEMDILSIIAGKFGWTIRRRSDILEKFLMSCPRNISMTDDEIQQEVNAVRYTE